MTSYWCDSHSVLGRTTLYPLTAGLLKITNQLDRIKADFPDLEQSDHAYLVMVEWRKETSNQMGDTSAGQMVKLLQKAKIDHHLVCLVCETPLCSLMLYAKRLERACFIRLDDKDNIDINIAWSIWNFTYEKLIMRGGILLSFSWGRRSSLALALSLWNL